MTSILIEKSGLTAKRNSKSGQFLLANLEFFIYVCSNINVRLA
jgi:hypothetical protein